MKLIIHIGMPKTGTTAIQYMLRDNTELLESNGILHPLIPGIGHAHSTCVFCITTPHQTFCVITIVVIFVTMSK